MHNKLIFTILKHYVKGEACPEEIFRGMSNKEWGELYKLSTKQGVSAIVYNMISALPKELRPSREIMLRWALQSENIERRGKMQLASANMLTSKFKANGIDTMVIKGLGLGIYYPTPEHRECGDFDCYLFDNFERGMAIATAEGATLGHEDYKHAQIRYKGLNVEVHKHFTSYRGDSSKHRFEVSLAELLRMQPCRPLNAESAILVANPTFNACFVIYHTLFHFLFESVNLRHILDWGLMVKAEAETIDWDRVIAICKEHRMLKFAEAMTAICNDFLGLELDIPIKAESPYRDRILRDIISEMDGVSNKKGWQRRFQLLKNTYKTRWKYEIIDTTFVADTIKRTFYFIFSNDKLKTS